MFKKCDPPPLPHLSVNKIISLMHNMMNNYMQL